MFSSAMNIKNSLGKIIRVPFIKILMHNPSTGRFYTIQDGDISEDIKIRMPQRILNDPWAYYELGVGGGFIHKLVDGDYGMENRLVKALDNFKYDQGRIDSQSYTNGEWLEMVSSAGVKEVGGQDINAKMTTGVMDVHSPVIVEGDEVIALNRVFYSYYDGTTKSFIGRDSMGVLVDTSNPKVYPVIESTVEIKSQRGGCRESH